MSPVTRYYCYLITRYTFVGNGNCSIVNRSVRFTHRLSRSWPSRNEMYIMRSTSENNNPGHEEFGSCYQNTTWPNLTRTAWTRKTGVLTSRKIPRSGPANAHRTTTAVHGARRVYNIHTWARTREVINTYDGRRTVWRCLRSPRGCCRHRHRRETVVLILQLLQKPPESIIGRGIESQRERESHCANIIYGPLICTWPTSPHLAR